MTLVCRFEIAMPPFTDPFYSNWALVLITIAGVWLALRSLNVLRKQTKHTRRAAEAAADGIKLSNRSNEIANVTAQAALKSADSIVRAERSWLLVNAEWVPGYKGVLIGDSEDGPFVYASLRLEFVNEGKSPAWIIDVRATLVPLGKLQEEPELDGIPSIDSATTPVGVAKPYILDNSFTVPANHRDELAVFGVVNYRDVFSEHLQTIFGFKIHYNNISRLTNPAYNRSH